MPSATHIHFPADHPAGPGHFPGNPIIPGALILDELIAALPHGATLIRAAKFFHPVRPGQTLHVAWAQTPSGALTFECRLATTDTLIATGILEPAPPAP